MPAKLSEATKRLRATQHKRPAPLPVGTPRLQEPIEPPSDLPAELREHWRRHMILVLASGRMSAVDLMAFREMVRVAYLCDIAYAAAVEEGPCVPGDKDVVKSGAAWRSYLNANAAYRASLARFGLDPKSRNTVPLLPGMPGDLRVVDADD